MIVYAQAVSAYAQKFVNAAKSKVTTYVAIGTAALNELLNSWDQTVALLPHFLVVHKQHLVSAAALMAIVSRVRREMTDKPPT